ncbi:MAG: hypothetical protein M3N34_10020 [Pseudomonadota bacterium]|nr:hypothetical protein [Pseudomonadota bacterium]
MALGAMVLAIIASSGSAPSVPHQAKAASISDVKLYQAISEAVSQGRPYYEAAAAIQRANGYPTAPGQVIREPALAYLLASLRVEVIQAALVGLMVGIIIQLKRVLDREARSMGARLGIIACALTGLSFAGVPSAIYVHEVWAALLMALSLLLYRSDRWAPSIALAFAACVLRELAAPFILAMGAAALIERRWAQALAWTLALVAFAAFYAVHLHLAAQQFRAGDLRSQGWVYFGGPGFVISTLRFNLLLHFLPRPAAVAGALLALLGLIGVRDPRTIRAALIAAGYMAAFFVVGRPDNYLWGFLYTPFLGIGLAFAPAAIADLFIRASCARSPISGCQE